MKSKLLVVPLVVLLTGCSGLMNMIPSFYDDNESEAIVDVWLGFERMDCSSEHLKVYLQQVDRDVEWLKLYSTAKKSTDVLMMVEKMDETLDGMLQKETINETYCNLKKKTLTNQAQAIAKSIMGRFK